MEKYTQKIIIVDSDDKYREILQTFLETNKFAKIIAEQDNVKGLIELKEICYCDVIILEIVKPYADSTNSIKNILIKCPGMNIVALMNLDWGDCFNIINKYDIKGYIIRQKDISVFKKALTEIFEGNLYYCKELLIWMKNISQENYRNCNILSKRENEVLKLFLNGFEEKEIADKLYINIGTVYGHMSLIRAKTGAKNSVELINIMKKNNLINPV